MVFGGEKIFIDRAIVIVKFNNGIGVMLKFFFWYVIVKLDNVWVYFFIEFVIIILEFYLILFKVLGIEGSDGKSGK